MSPTRRQLLAEILRGRPATVPELAEELGVPIRRVVEDLEHLARSLPRGTLRLEPAVCPQCGRVFRQRTRYTRPSRCPDCRGERVSWPVIGIED